jgi:hypothetical protein
MEQAPEWGLVQNLEFKLDPVDVEPLAPFWSILFACPGRLNDEFDHL